MIKAVLFDVDGTLIDSNDLHAAAWREAFRHFGVDLPLDEQVLEQIHQNTGIEPGAASLVREGATWALTYAGRTVRLRDAKGLRAQ